jgi:acetyltransferase
MAIKLLDKIFKPKRIALIGVSNNPKSIGGIVLNNLIGSGFDGVIYTVNPRHEAVMGIMCYPDVKRLPSIPDLAVIATGAKLVPQIVRECGEAGIKGVIILSAGFKESGAEGKKLEDEVKTELTKFDDMRIIGPNCVGIIVPELQLNITFTRGMPKKGNIAFISQSGALCTTVLDWALEENIGFSYFVSIGNTMDVNFGDLIDYFGQDPDTKSIVLYIESITEARSFMAAARNFARKKPILVYKAGRFPESAKAAASHTGALASEDSIYNAVFARAGIARVYDIEDIFDFTDIVSRKRIPKGSNLAIVTNAGGPGVMATDTFLDLKGNLAELSEQTMQKLNDCLPQFWSHGNPVDVIGDASTERYAQATKIVLDDPNVDAVLVIFVPQAVTDPTDTAIEICKLADSTSKSIIAAWAGGQSMHKGRQIFIKKDIAVFHTPEQAVRAFMTLVSYSRNLQILYETPKDIPVEFTLDRNKLRKKFETEYFIKNNILSEDISKEIIHAYGIGITKPQLAYSASDAMNIANKIGYPVVLKILSPDITHKSDVGGVVLNLNDEACVAAAYKNMVKSISRNFPDADIQGVTVQPMYDIIDAVELILGIKKDPVFGTVILLGMGGTYTELFRDKRLCFPPVNERLARQMIESLKIYPVLKGYRGSPPKNIDKLIEIIIRLSYLAADYPEIEELDINPLLVTPKDVVALDARIVIDQSLVGKKIPQFSHLLIRPYPEKYVKPAKLSDGTNVILRPIKPEDEPMWLELLDSCSKESIYFRFRTNFFFDSHEVATQFCYIDYSREMAIVAEITENNNRKLIGVVRLIANPDHEIIEYAILITDEWQNKNLGNILTLYCLEISKELGLKRIVAETTTDNKPMIAIFKKLKFRIHFNADSTVSVFKDLNQIKLN